MPSRNPGGNPDRGGRRPAGRHRIRGLLPILPLLFLMGLAACDFPTELPQWDQRWILPADETTVEVGEILPDDVFVTPDGSAFSVTVPPLSFQASLGSLCTACQVLDGLTAPKPPFQGSFGESTPLPSEVVRVDGAEGRVLVEARNGFGFDPIRPSAGSTGTITLSLFSRSTSGPLLDRIVVDGATEGFPPGSTLSKTLAFSGSVEEAFVVRMEVSSPLGDPVTIDVTDAFSVDATVLELEIASAVADLSGQEFAIEETELDLGDLDEGMVDRIRSGAIEFDVENPWSVGASFIITITGPFPPITKAFSIPGAPTSSGRVDFSGEELQSFLGQDDVFLVGSGVVDANAGEAPLFPGQVLTLDTELALIIRVGGGEN